jgi:hypothetical protein
MDVKMYLHTFSYPLANYHERRCQKLSRAAAVNVSVNIVITLAVRAPHPRQKKAFPASSTARFVLSAPPPLVLGRGATALPPP